MMSFVLLVLTVTQITGKNLSTVGAMRDSRRRTLQVEYWHILKRWSRGSEISHTVTFPADASAMLLTERALRCPQMRSGGDIGAYPFYHGSRESKVISLTTETQSLGIKLSSRRPCQPSR
jgi:hypothetical protein